jgi:hypothetical protein
MVRIAYLNKGIVQHKHDSSRIPSPGLTPEKHLANITYISNFGMSQTKLPLLLLVQMFEELVVQTHQTTSDVYKTSAATTTVKINPGTSPRTE